MIMDSNHDNPNQHRVISDPVALETLRSAGVRDIVIESDPPWIARYREMQQQNLSRDQIRERIATERLHVEHTFGINYQRELDNRADMVFHTGRLGITLHGYDDMAGLPLRANQSLSEADRETLRTGFLPWASEEEQSAAYSIAGSAMLRQLELERSSFSNPNSITKNDARIVDEVARYVGSRPVVMIYGAGHMLGGRDMDEMLTARTGRPTSTFMMVDDWRGNNAVNQLTDRRTGVDLPDFIYDGSTGEVRATRWHVRGEGQVRLAEHRAGLHQPTNIDGPILPQNVCLQAENLMRRGCSTQILPPVDVSPAIPVASLPAVPLSNGQMTRREARSR